jgi:hypothetical protein
MTLPPKFTTVSQKQFHLTVFVICFMFSGLALAQDLQSWSVKIDDGAKRFQVLAAFNHEAVLDKETQLVWERTPDRDVVRWPDAVAHCQNAIIGGRLGWRLPSMAELFSLLDLSVVGVRNNIPLPLNHPFILKVILQFWSIDTYDGKNALVIDLPLWGASLRDAENGGAYAWCVRSS